MLKNLKRSFEKVSSNKRVSKFLKLNTLTVNSLKGKDKFYTRVFLPSLVPSILISPAFLLINTVILARVAADLYKNVKKEEWTNSGGQVLTSSIALRSYLVKSELGLLNMVKTLAELDLSEAKGSPKNDNSSEEFQTKISSKREEIKAEFKMLLAEVEEMAKPVKIADNDQAYRFSSSIIKVKQSL